VSIAHRSTAKQGPFKNEEKARTGRDKDERRKLHSCRKTEGETKEVQLLKPNEGGENYSVTIISRVK
jgi:hypothetical protein